MEREFWFIASRFWVVAHETSLRYDGEVSRLNDAGGIATCDSSDGKTVAVFSDDALAHRFAEACGASGFTAALIEGPDGFIAFLEDMKSQDCRCVAPDPEYGAAKIHTCPIDKAINDVRTRTP